MLFKCSPLTIVQRTGLSGAPTLVALTSEESHYSIVKVGQEKQLEDNSYLKICSRLEIFLTGGQLVGHGGRQCCEGDCKIEYVDSPLKVLTDSGGRMIPEELDKALDKVKAEGRVSYQRS